MNENLIKKYVTINNINLLAKKEGIILKDYETNIIYETIINNYETICYGDPLSIFVNLKRELREDTYNLVIKLYNKYKPFLSQKK